MKVLNKITPYSIKRAVPVLGMAFATMLGGCKKHETPEPKPTPKFERTFVWGIYMNLNDFINKVSASADSAQVAKIILQSSGEDWGGGGTVSEFVNLLIDPVTNACGKNKHKLTHTGTILRPCIRNNTPEEYAAQQADSAKLANLGYTIVKPLYSR